MESKIPWTDGIEIVPSEIAVCPECGGVMQVEVNEIEQNEDGTWEVASPGLYMSCKDDEENPNCKKLHYQTPYIDWLPLEDKVLKWLNSNFLFSDKASK